MIIAKKSLGQNFLVDKEILNLIVNLTAIVDKSILEIGPGTGNLTSLILKKKPKEFWVVEKDNNLAEKLYKNYNNKIKVINKDIVVFLTQDAYIRDQDSIDALVAPIKDSNASISYGRQVPRVGSSIFGQRV